MRFNTRHLEYIVEASMAGSIRAASKKVGISEPAISAAIKTIEDHVGYPLFVRSTSRGIHLTPQGGVFINQAKLLLERIGDFERAVFFEGSEIIGPIRVGCYFISAPFLIGRIFSKLADLAPGLKPTIVEGTLEEVIADLKEGRTDIAFTYDVFHDNSLAYDLLFEVHPHLLIGKNDPLSRRASVSIEDMRDRPCAVLDLPLSNRETEFMDIFRHCGVKPNIRYKVKNFELIRSLVGANLAYAFGRLPIRTTSSYDGNLVMQKPIQESLPSFKMCIVYPKSTANNKVNKWILSIARSVLGDVQSIGSHEMHENLSSV